MDSKKLNLLPDKPGSYQFLDENGIVIYVGKAKSLKKRVNSYFNKLQTGKTALLVSEIRDINFLVTNSELEALLLEINLIKKYNPKYNILLKDDKTYPYIALSKDGAPFLKVIRNTKNKTFKELKLFGPYPNVYAARDVVNMLNRLYPLRKCNPIKKEICLYYHMGSCLGYCEKEVDKDLVKKYYDEVSSFLNGNNKDIIKKLESEMQKASDKMDYEKALDIKKTLDNIKIVAEKQVIDLGEKSNLDVFNYYIKDNKISICIFFIRDGLLLGKINEIFDYKDNVFSDFIINFYENNKLLATEILVPDIDTEVLANYLSVSFKNPKRGKLKHLLDLVKENASVHLKLHIKEIIVKDSKKKEALDSLKKILGKEVIRIFSFDNSHLFGEYYVGAMVAFDSFEKNKNLYRKFRIRSESKNDLSALKEVVYRYFFKVLTEGEASCDLLLIDGGENQVKAAKLSLEELGLEIPVWGLKKDLKHRAKSVVDNNIKEIDIDNNLFLFLSRIDEEAHRFAITYHRSLKNKGMYKTVLDDVKGLGPKRKRDLLKKYKNIDAIKKASLEDLTKILPETVANELIKIFNFNNIEK